MCSSSPVRTPKSQLAADQPSKRECWNHQEKLLHIQGQRRSSKMVGGVQSHLKLHICQRLLEGINKILCAPKPMERSSDPHKRLSQTCLWVLEGLLQRHGSAVASHGDRSTGSNSAGRHSRWYKSSWRRSPLAPLQSCWMGDPQTGEQLYQRSSHAVVKVQGPTTDFQTWGSGKGTGNPQGMWLWMSVGFDYKTPTALGK